MSSVPKKRIFLDPDGYYYPQYRKWFLWHDYNMFKKTLGFVSTRYDTQEEAEAYLERVHKSNLESVKTALNSKIIKWPRNA